MNTRKVSTTAGIHVHIVLVYRLLNPKATTQKAPKTIFYDIHRPIICKSRRKNYSSIVKRYLKLMSTSKGSTTAGIHIHIVLVYCLLNPTSNTQKASITI